MIEAIIFDFGGVICKSVFVSTAELLENRINIPKKGIEKAMRDNKKEYALGKQSGKDNWKSVSKALAADLDSAECAEILRTFKWVNTDLLKIVGTLGKKYKIFLLSDNFKERSEAIKKKFGEYFDRMYFSNEMGILKPHKKAFEIVLKENKLKPEECIFIDDKENIVEGAKACGLHAIQYKNLGQLKFDLKALGINTI